MKRIFLSALLIAGCAAETNAGAEGCRGLEGSEPWHIQAQVAQKEEAALPQYFFGKTEEGVRGLSDLISTYRRAQCTDLVPQANRDALQYNELLAVGRLARLYEKLGNKEEADAEAQRAVALGRIVLRNPSWSTADLTKLISDVDVKQRAHIEKVRDEQK